MSATKAFKVIVAGSGPVGLTAAHALTSAGIDFVVLESRPSIVIDAGSNLVLLPTGLRLLGQLGMFDALDRISSPLSVTRRFDHKGHDIGDFRVFQHMRENHGLAPRIISRHDLTKVLFESLPKESQDKMHANKKVASIATSPDGVTVRCADGTEYEGSIIIGADGAHSKVRGLMRSLAVQAAADAGEAEINAEHPFLTTYRALWVRFPTQADLQPGDSAETHGPGCAIQTFAGDETSVIGMYERMDEPTRTPPRYGPTDQEAFVERWGHLPISSQLTVRQAYDSREEAGLVNLEEGVVEHWGWDRIVLVGDAAHKFTPSTGQGCNNGIADVAVLVNQLRKVVRSAPHGAAPSAAAVAAAFRDYQAARFEAVDAGLAGSSQATAVATWQSTAFRLVDQFVLSWGLVQTFFMDRAAKGMARAPILDFVKVKDMPRAKVQWVSGN